jgi:tRNA U34 5-methylaminomethyl-2-thiouridine-forming methyltransferase MnmC
MSIILTSDGSHSVYSEVFGVTYHSIHGAVQETQHVFINAAFKYKITEGVSELRILEIGMGTGLNAFMTFLEVEKLNIKTFYTAYEAYPISFEQAQSLNYTQVLNTTPQQSDIFNKIHTSTWHEQHPLSHFFHFTKIIDKFENINIHNVFDIIYFDAFAPQAQPTLWEKPLMEKMYNALKNKGILTTYCAQGQFRRTLKEVGFKVEKLQGPPHKREMTRSIKL